MVKYWKTYKKEWKRCHTSKQRNTSRPTDLTHKIFDKSYAANHETKAVLTLNKPV